MIDLNSVFQFHPLIKNCHENYSIWRWDVPGDLPYFDGHFPNQPILPAVAIIDANLELLKIISEQKLHLSQIITSKFLSPVIPKIRVSIKIQKNLDSSWTFEWKNSEKNSSDNILNQMTLLVDFFIASDAKK
jgi:3-hydroxymyristoyl/3-hydroxydecanoyl-(acyl carrier protein) dehydratase